MDMPATLKQLLSGLAVPVYALARPANSHLPALVYRTISDSLQDQNNESAGQLHLSRVQITHVAGDYAALQSLVSSVRGKLEANKTDFPAAISTDIHIEDRESDTVYSTVKDYFIQWKE